MGSIYLLKYGSYLEFFGASGLRVGYMHFFVWEIRSYQDFIRYCDADPPRRVGCNADTLVGRSAGVPPAGPWTSRPRLYNPQKTRMVHKKSPRH